MIVYTVQMSKWRKCKDSDIKLYDTTVKSGDPVFAPTWDIVMGSKKGVLREDEYTEKYQKLMRDSYRTNKDKRLEICNYEKPLALACYCKAGKFCHRHLLLNFMEAVCNHHNIPFQYKGELE